MTNSGFPRAGWDQGAEGDPGAKLCLEEGRDPPSAHSTALQEPDLVACSVVKNSALAALPGRAAWELVAGDA